MKGNHAALVAVGVGAVGLYLVRAGRVSAAGLPAGATAGVGGFPYAPTPDSLYAGYGGASGPRTTVAGNVSAIPGRPTGPSAPIGALTGVGTTAAAAGIGLTSAAAVATAGIAAGGALLAWGIVEKGWFRGGEEGVKVNPARDAYLSSFAQYDYMRDASNPPGFYGLANILAILGRHELFDTLNHADTMAEFSAAVNDIASALARATQEQIAQAKSAAKY